MKTILHALYMYTNGLKSVKKMEGRSKQQTPRKERKRHLLPYPLSFFAAILKIMAGLVE